jgi:glycosyltransferase involved in cell wall biosynthesis
MTVATTSLRGQRIAHLIESDGPGGAERVVAGLAGALQARGAENVVIVPERGEGWLARQLDGTGVTILPGPLDRPFRAVSRWLAGVFATHRVALAHSHEFIMALCGAWAARRAGVPHVFTMHGSRYYASRWRRRIALRVAADLSGGAVAVSQSVARHLSRDLWLRASRIVTIPNGASISAVSRSSLRDELGLEARDQLALAVGNLYPVKGHRYLVEALGLLADHFPHLHVAVAGRGELEGPLRTQAGAQGLAGRFHLLGLRSDIGNLLAGVDIFVLPSLSEGLPLALVEAMLAARPIVATAVGEIPVVLEDGRAGAVVPPGDAAALARALATLLNDRAYARELGAAAARRAHAEYTADRMVERYVALYAKRLGWNPVLAPGRADPPLEARQVAAVETAVGRERA